MKKPTNAQIVRLAVLMHKAASETFQSPNGYWVDLPGVVKERYLHTAQRVLEAGYRKCKPTE